MTDQLVETKQDPSTEEEKSSEDDDKVLFKLYKRTRLVKKDIELTGKTVKLLKTAIENDIILVWGWSTTPEDIKSMFKDDLYSCKIYDVIFTPEESCTTLFDNTSSFSKVSDYQLQADGIVWGNLGVHKST